VIIKPSFFSVYMLLLPLNNDIFDSFSFEIPIMKSKIFLKHFIDRAPTMYGQTYQLETSITNDMMIKTLEQVEITMLCEPVNDLT
jgi:hypothetical protein